MLDINEDTLHEWKKVHPDFSESLKEGKERADANVAQRLYDRAMGNGRLPPDVTACIFWLKNRRKQNWREKPLEEQIEDVMIAIKKIQDAGIKP